MNHKVAKDFFLNNKHLFEGVLVFECCGIRFFIPPMANRFKRAAYEVYLDEETKEKIDLSLWDRPVSFFVHRDVVSNQEWCVFLEETDDDATLEMGGV